MLYLNGSRSHPVIISVGDRRHRLLELEEGDVAQHRLKDDRQQMLYSKDGTYISTRSDKVMRIALVAKEGGPATERHRSNSRPTALAAAARAAAAARKRKRKPWARNRPRMTTRNPRSPSSRTGSTTYSQHGEAYASQKGGSDSTCTMRRTRKNPRRRPTSTRISGLRIIASSTMRRAIGATSPILVKKDEYCKEGDARALVAANEPAVSHGVDNAAVKGMDFSALLRQPDLWMVQWTEGKGEIERSRSMRTTSTNLNGLREQFIDVMPYAPFFQQFLTLMQAQGLLLPQAKKVQIDLIDEIFEHQAAGAVSLSGCGRGLLVGCHRCHAGARRRVPAIPECDRKDQRRLSRDSTRSSPALNGADASTFPALVCADQSTVRRCLRTINTDIVMQCNTQCVRLRPT